MKIKLGNLTNPIKIIRKLEELGEIVQKVPTLNPAYSGIEGFIENSKYYCSKRAQKIINLLEKEGRFVEKEKNINPAYIYHHGLEDFGNFFVG